MPQITIDIDERQEASIRELIDNRKHFRICGGQLIDTDGKKVFLQHIEFVFYPDKCYKTTFEDELAVCPPFEVT